MTHPRVSTLIYHLRYQESTDFRYTKVLNKQSIGTFDLVIVLDEIKRITKANGLLPLGAMTVFTKFHKNPYNSC